MPKSKIGFRKKEAVRVISTQLVEAGVMWISRWFTGRWRDWTPLLRAAGRCNREASYQS
ncbi:MAG: hypothetical protein R3F37_11240 [Candidatus Competibacteraceae bacterium]